MRQHITPSKYNREVYKMIHKETRELKLDEILEELYYLRDENVDLKLENQFLEHQVAILKADNRRLTHERNELINNHMGVSATIFIKTGGD